MSCSPDMPYTLCISYRKASRLSRPNGPGVHGKEKDMSHITLTDFVEATSKKFNIPGVAVGVWADGKEISAFHGVTSVENPLPIDQDTLFLPGSVTKTVTATTLMRLVAEGKVELHAPVRRYIPDLRLKDEQTADQATV